jgi:hypothetical protein
VLPSIPPRPTRKAAQQALAALKGLLAEVAFASELDRSVALAALLTTVARGAFDTTPMFLVKAAMPGTGKSYLVDVIAHIATGRWAPATAKGATGEELEKRLVALLFAAPPIISLDNIPAGTTLDNDMLAQMIDRPIVKSRILGKSETTECEWRGTIFGTGNNVNPTGDAVRRTMLINLTVDDEYPEQREFKSDAIAEVLKDRGRWVAAALTIVRAYLVSGTQVQCKPFGFVEWSRFIREPLIWLDEPDPLLSHEQARADDPRRNDALRLMELWKLHLGTEKSYASHQIIECARETRRSAVLGDGPDWEHVRPEFYQFMLDTVGTQRGNEIDVRRLGNWLKQLKGQVYAGFKIVAARESASHGNWWRLVKVVGAGAEVGA